MEGLLFAGIALLALGGVLFWQYKRVDKDIKEHPTTDEGPRRTEILPDGRVRIKSRREGPYYGAWAIVHDGQTYHCPELWEDTQEKAEKVAEDHRRIGYAALVKKATGWSDGIDNWTVWLRELSKEQLKPYLLKRLWYAPIMFKRYAWTPSWTLTAVLVAMPIIIIAVFIVIPAIRGEL